MLQIKNYPEKDAETRKSEEEESDEEYESAAESISESDGCTSDCEEELEQGNEDDYIQESGSEDDEVGWITPSNIQDLRQTSNKSCVEEKPVAVGCMSTDFAIQVGVSVQPV